MSDVVVDLQLAEPNPDDPVYKLLHDLRGPLVNIKGFSRELKIAAEQLGQLISWQTDSLTVDARRELNDLLKNDIETCLNFLDGSVQQMDERLDRFASSRDTAKAAGHTGSAQC